MRTLITALALSLAALIGCASQVDGSPNGESDVASASQTITSRDLDQLAPPARLELSLNRHYRFDPVMGAIDYDRIDLVDGSTVLRMREMLETWAADTGRSVEELTSKPFEFRRVANETAGGVRPARVGVCYWEFLEPSCHGSECIVIYRRYNYTCTYW